MRTTCFNLFLCLLILLLPATASAEDDVVASVQDVLARGLEATGGDALAAATGLHIVGHISVSGLEGTIDGWEDLHTGRAQTAFDLGIARGAEGFDGEHIWSQDGSGQVQVDESQGARERTANQAYLRSFAYFFPDRWPAETRYARRTNEGEGEGERSFHVIAVKPEGGRSFELWIDAETYLVDRTVDDDGRDTTTDRYADYRLVEGVLLAFELRSGSGEAKYDQTVRIERYEVLHEVSEARFVMPESRSDDFQIAGGAASTVVPFNLMNNHIYVDAVINGKPLQMLVDTGGANVLTPKIAKALGLEPAGAFAGRGVGEETVDVGLVKVKRLMVGGVLLTDQIFYTIPLGIGHVEGLSFGGLVGYEVFKRFVVTIDYLGGRLVLTRPEDFEYQGEGTAVPFAFDGQMPLVEGSIDGIAGVFTIDTGSRSSLSLHAPFIAEHGLWEHYAPPVVTTTGWGVGGPVRGGVVRGGVLKLGTVAVNGPVVDLPQVEKGAFTDQHVSGNVGSGLLKRFTVTFDYSRQQMILEKNERFAAPDVYDRAGLWINRDDDGAYRVVDVVEGGPAARAGLHVDDRIVTIDGKPTARLALFSVRQAWCEMAPGTAVKVVVAADDEKREVTIVLADLI